MSHHQATSHRALVKNFVPRLFLSNIFYTSTTPTSLSNSRGPARTRQRSWVIGSSKATKPRRRETLRQQQQCRTACSLKKHDYYYFRGDASLSWEFTYTTMVSLNPTKISLLIWLPFQGRWGRRIKNDYKHMAQFLRTGTKN